MPAPSASAPPGPRARFPGELLKRFTGPGRLAFLTELPARYGDVCAFRIGQQPVVLLSHPDDIRDVLVTNQRAFMKGRGLQRAKLLIGEGLLTSEGDVHLRQRRLVQPAFHRARIAAYARGMAAAAGEMRESWRAGPVDINAEMMRLTLTIVARTLFGAEVSGASGAVATAMHDALAAFNLGLGPLAPLFDRLPVGRTRRFKRARATLDAIVFRMIAERRRPRLDAGQGTHDGAGDATQEGTDDLLSMLLEAQDADGDGTGMSDQQLRDELLTIFLAGHETTANALSWTWMLLTRHPSACAALEAEVDAVLGDRLPTADDVPQLTFTRAVLAESMRLYPPAFILGRQALEPYPVREWTLPAGTLVLTSQYVVHRDPRWWPEPKRFRPERWTEADQRPKFAYFPFGGGTRICVGESFAWTEAVILLATLARRWRVVVSSPDPRPQAVVTLRPGNGMPAELRAR